jgi:hypothetical protein
MVHGVRIYGILGAALALALASCGEPDTESGPGAVTVGEARALADAAKMLQPRPVDSTSAPTARSTSAR